MARVQKKVVIRMLAGGLIRGYLPAAGFREGAELELLEASGKTIRLALNEIQTIFYVRDFDMGNNANPEGAGRWAFAGRPRNEGLWVRLTLKGGEKLEGLASADIAFVDAMLADGGMFLTPPDARGNTLRLFVPRGALDQMEILGVIRPAAKKTGLRTGDTQAGLFDES